MDRAGCSGRMRSQRPVPSCSQCSAFPLAAFTPPPFPPDRRGARPGVQAVLPVEGQPADLKELADELGARRPLGAVPVGVGGGELRRVEGHASGEGVRGIGQAVLEPDVHIGDFDLEVVEDLGQEPEDEGLLALLNHWWAVDPCLPNQKIVVKIVLVGEQILTLDDIRGRLACRWGNDNVDAIHRDAGRTRSEIFPR